MLAIVTTHPIQYQVPIWKELARRKNVPFEVIFLCDHGYRESYDREFGAAFSWDTDLLEGYRSRFLTRGRSPNGFFSLRLSARGWMQMWTLQPDAVWIQGWQVAGYWEAAVLSRLRASELWLRAETNLRSGSGRFRFKRQLALRALFSLVSRFLFIGSVNRDFYLTLSVAPERLVAAPYCVDNTAFRIAAAHLLAERGANRAAWGVSSEAYCFLFVGKFI